MMGVVDVMMVVMEVIDVMEVVEEVMVVMANDTANTDTYPPAHTSDLPWINGASSHKQTTEITRRRGVGGGPS